MNNLIAIMILLTSISLNVNSHLLIDLIAPLPPEQTPLSLLT